MFRQMPSFNASKQPCMLQFLIVGMLLRALDIAFNRVRDSIALIKDNHRLRASFPNKLAQIFNVSWSWIHFSSLHAPGGLIS